MKQEVELIANALAEQVDAWGNAVRVIILPAAVAAIEPYREDIRSAVNSYIACLVAIGVFIV